MLDNNKVGVEVISKVQEASGYKAASVAKAAGLEAANRGVEGASFVANKGETVYRADRPLTKKQQDQVGEISQTMIRKAGVMKNIKLLASKIKRTLISVSINYTNKAALSAKGNNRLKSNDKANFIG